MKNDTRCDAVQLLVASATRSDGPLPAAAEAHLRDCADCGGLRAARTRVVAAIAARPRPPALPGLEVRVAAGARQRLKTRQRQRLFVSLAGVATVAAVTLLALRWPSGGRHADNGGLAGATAHPPAPTAPAPLDPTPVPPAPEADHELYAALVELSDVEAGLSIRARWGEVEEPIGATFLLAPDTRGGRQ